MVDSLHDWLKWIIGGLLTIGAWVMRRLHVRVDSLEESHNGHMLHVSRNYTPKADLHDMRSEIRQNFVEMKKDMERIYDKLDGKADK